MTSAFQLLFTNERVVDFEFDSSQWGLYSYNPQLHNNDTSVDTMNWRTAQWIYTAQGGEQWLTIGNFIPNEQLVWSAISPAPSDTEISYLYIDDVMVVNLDNAQIPTLNDTAICGTFSHTLDAQGGYEWYLWNTGATTQTINITTFGTYWVQCGATCGTFTDTIHIYDAALLDFSLPTPPSICSGLSTTYYTAPSFYSTYSWSTGATTQTIELAYPGDYRCTVTTGCSTFVDSMVVNLSNDADYQLELGADVDICKDGDNTVAILKTLNRKFDNYLWSTGDTTFYLITYNIGSFILEGSYHCGKSFDTITVVGCPPDDTYDLFVPNAFTPNSDEINDNFEIYHRNLSINMMRLYDRWGNKIFECNPCDNINWNGMYNGKLITGVIVYYIEATVTQSGRTISKKGNITVLQ